MLVILAALAAGLLLLPSGASAARRRAATPAPNVVTIDGPDATISSLNGLSIARDGTGGLVYAKAAGRVSHVYLSQLIGGTFQAPVAIDGGLPPTSSQPVVVAGNGGLLIVAFINNGSLYVASTPGGGTPLSAPSLLYAGAADPALAISNFGKAYLAFTAGGGTVRAAYYSAGQWGLESAPLNHDPAASAGTGGGRPQVATAGDGVGIVTWGEGGHIYTRRVVGTTASVVDEQADPSSLDGWSEVSATDPVISVGGDSSYVNVAFTETFGSGATRQTRVLANRLRGSQYDGISRVDGGAMGSDSADQPSTASTEYGDGFITSESASGHTLTAAHMANNEAVTGVIRVDSLANAGPADAVAATAGLTSTFIAWQQDPGTAGPAEIRLRYAQDGVNLAGEQVLSSPALGPTDAAAGLVAAGDVQGDAAIAWVQGSAATTRVVAEQLYVPPGGFSTSDRFHYVTTATPVLSWTAAAENWGAPQYTVTVDRTIAGQTTAQQLQVPAGLTDGRHRYQVSAANPAGVATAAPAATVFVDTVAPQLRLRLTGPRRLPHRERATVAYTDLPPAGLPGADASGVATVVIHWGDGTTQRIRRTTADHVYRRPRTYRVTVVATDRAGNATTVTSRLTVRGIRHRATRRRRGSRRGTR